MSGNDNIAGIEKKFLELGSLAHIEMIEDQMKQTLKKLELEFSKQSHFLDVEGKISENLELDLKAIQQEQIRLTNENTKISQQLAVEVERVKKIETHASELERSLQLAKERDLARSELSTSAARAQERELFEVTSRKLESEIHELRIRASDFQIEISRLKSELQETRDKQEEQTREYSQRIRASLMEHGELQDELLKEKEKNLNLQVALGKAQEDESQKANDWKTEKKVQVVSRELELLRAENAELEEISVTLKSDISELKSRHRRQVEALQSESEGLREEIYEKNRQNEKLKNELSRSLNEAESIRNRQRSHSADEAGFDFQKTQQERDELLRKFYSAEADLRMAKASAAQHEEAIKKLISENERFHAENLEKERNLRTVSEEMRELKRSFDLVKNELQREKEQFLQKTMEHNAFRLQSQLEIQKTQSHAEALKKEKDSLQEELGLLRHRVQGNKVEMQKQINEQQRLKEENQNFKNAIQLFERATSELKEKMREQAERIQQQASKIEFLQNRTVEQEKSLDTQASEIQVQLTNIKELEEEIKDHKEEVEKQRHLADSIQAQLREANSNYLATLAMKDDKAAEKIAERQLELQSLAAEIAKREQNLRSFAERVDKEKSQVLSYAKGLAKELKSAVTLHPLKDYLSFTEKEISRLDGELKKTPVVSQERPRLEQVLGQLIEQRDFLKSVVTRSEKQLSERADQLLQLAQSGKLAQMPPPFTGPK